MISKCSEDFLIQPNNTSQPIMIKVFEILPQEIKAKGVQYSADVKTARSGKYF